MRLIYISIAFKWQIWSTKVPTFGTLADAYFPLRSAIATQTIPLKSLAQVLISFQWGNCTRHQPHEQTTASGFLTKIQQY